MMPIAVAIQHSLREKRRGVSGVMSRRDSTTGNVITYYLRYERGREHEPEQ